jgi:phi13 family phage major tail protein
VIIYESEETKMTKVPKPIGARKLTWFPLIDDTDTDLIAAAYATAVRLSRLIEITITPILAEGLLESDDGLEENEASVVGYDVKITASQLTDAIRAAALGHSIDDGSGILTNSNDAAPLGALAWEELLSGGGSVPKYKKVVLYKGNFKEFEEKATTVVRAGKAYQTHGLQGTFYRRDFDGNIKYSIREDSPNANATKLAAWFTTPQEYGDELGTTVATPAADPVAGAVAAGTNVELTCATSGAVIRYTLDGTTPGASSTLYDGPITINVPLTIKAAGFKAGMNPSIVLSAAYTIAP